MKDKAATTEVSCLATSAQASVVTASAEHEIAAAAAAADSITTVADRKLVHSVSD